ncbi:putative retrotransposon hot spot protein (RHS) [Trypanosoma cruzi]|uniref:Putative retrotransposon hot spot protein (RHS) n=1 Tax=Trypanosoma cruzi TaxID=5693 RepID=A0A2V2XGQ5_TRYCR|nr:putative retrotransposon hot spot protein (RHS) [Trypanosoma cruzi]
MEIAVRKEMSFCEDLRSLYNKGVHNLMKWSELAAEVKAGVHGITRDTLDAALVDVRNRTTTSAPMKPEGFYESVHNARWHHVVEVSGGEGMGMGVHEGKPQQSWTYMAVGQAVEKDDGVQQSGAPRPRLMVLTSDKGWPYSWEEDKPIVDCYVNCEVDRVWQIVKGDVTEWFSPGPGTYFTPHPRVMIGTPGIGKSVAAGSYLLYQLLHYDVEELQVVVHCFGITMYVFDKTVKMVPVYMGNKTSKIVLGGLWQSGMKGYIIYDVARKGTPPETGFLPPTGWGMIVVSSPKASNYDEWEKQTKAARIIMNCPDEVDVKAMCVWITRGLEPDKQAGYLEMVEKRMDKVGMLLCYTFDKL